MRRVSEPTQTSCERERMRRKDREVADRKEVEAILRRAKVLRLALFDEDYPYITPLHYGFLFDEGNLVFYMHGALQGRKLELIRRNPNVCVELDCDVEPISGGDVACRYGSQYASIVARGRAAVVEAPEEKRKGLKLLMANQTGRDFEFGAKELSMVAVIRVAVERWTAKARRA